jgi:hypothetical protein
MPHHILTIVQTKSSLVFGTHRMMSKNMILCDVYYSSSVNLCSVYFCGLFLSNICPLLYFFYRLKFVVISNKFLFFSLRTQILTHKRKFHSNKIFINNLPSILLYYIFLYVVVFVVFAELCTK